MSTSSWKRTSSRPTDRILLAYGDQQRRLIQLMLRTIRLQGRVDAVQVGGVDLHFAVLRLRNRNLAGFDRAQDRGFIPADRGRGCYEGVHGVLATVAMSRYGGTDIVNKW